MDLAPQVLAAFHDRQLLPAAVEAVNTIIVECRARPAVPPFLSRAFEKPAAVP
jgi:hypothetical protein